MWFYIYQELTAGVELLESFYTFLSVKNTPKFANIWFATSHFAFEAQKSILCAIFMAKIYSLNVKDGRVQSVVTQLLWLSILVFYVCMPPGHQPLQK